MNPSGLEDRTAALEAALTELRNQGNTIRQLKADLLQQVTGDESGDEEHHQRKIERAVARLNELKQRHCGLVLWEIQRLMEQQQASTSSATTNDGNQTSEQSIRDLENLLPSSEAKKLKKKRRGQRQKQLAARERQFDVTRGTESVLCQRKIYNLLAHDGHDDTFRYFFRINPSVLLAEGEPVYLTEKMDGTTMQATNQGVFKRFERKVARESGDWHQLSESERYAVERVDLNNRTHRQMAQAVTPYLPLFDKLPDGVCIYFEAIGPHIGARFRDTDLPHTIQVFDSSTVETGEFASFEKTIELCRDLGLPVVAHRLMPQLNLASILDTLSQEPRYSHFEVPLEGFVVRPLGSSGAAAKIRVDDLPSIVDHWQS